MKSTWAALALIVAGLVVILMRPAFLADGQDVSVYSFSGTVVPWIGWLLLAAGVVTAIFAYTRARKKKSDRR